MTPVRPRHNPNARMPRMPRRLTLVLLALALLGLAAFWLWRLRGPLVPAVIAQQAPLLRTLQFSARVATASRVDVGSTVTGRVLRVAVIEGDEVRAGALLVQLENDELRAALDQARATEQQAAARLAGLRSTGRSGALAGVAQADSVLLAARADLQRNQDLLARGFVSPARLDEARRAVAVAQAQQDAARALRLANGDNGTDVAQARAQLALASAATAGAHARLAQATLTAPADGRVLARLVEPGQIVQPGKPLLSLALAGPRQLVAQVDERYLQQLQVGQLAGVRADAFPDQRFAARILRIAPLVDAQRGAVELKFTLPQAPAFLREDMTLSVEVETARRQRTLVLPLDALRSEDSSSATATVWLARDGRVQARPLQLGLRTLDAVEVLQGLAAGDVVLLAATAAPGQRVRADTSAAAARPSAAGASAGHGESAGSALTNAMGR